jgi:hypothetical protein
MRNPAPFRTKQAWLLKIVISAASNYKLALETHIL